MEALSPFRFAEVPSLISQVEMGRRCAVPPDIEIFIGR